MSAEDGRIPSALRKSIEPLAEWYRVNKPTVLRMVISQDDFDRLKGASKATLARNNFRCVGGNFYWNEFELARK
jgi:hypothetical protein